MTSIIYIVDALIKDAGRLSVESKEEIRSTILNEIDYKNIPYPYRLPLVRLCSAASYEDSSIMAHLIDNHRAQDNALFFREAILLGYNQIDRARLRTLAADTFKTQPPPVKRAILYAIINSKRMKDDERRPLVKNIHESCEDWFIRIQRV